MSATQETLSIDEVAEAMGTSIDVVEAILLSGELRGSRTDTGWTIELDDYAILWRRWLIEGGGVDADY